MEVLSFGKTDIGQKRSTNQDSICLIPKHHFFCVADGMGGHNGGDIASQMSVKLLDEFVNTNIKLQKDELMKKAFQHVNLEVFKYGESHEELKGMGTTLTGIMIDDGQLYVGNVGDSRTYMINNNQLYQLTRDHSLVQEKLNLGIYNRMEANLDQQKNVLIKTIGFEENVDIDVYRHKINKNDMFLMCSDGLHGKVSDADIIYIVNKEIPDPSQATIDQIEACVTRLVDQANANGGNDNISVIIALTK